MSSKKCEHQEFHVEAKIARLAKEEGGPITHYGLELTVTCRDCGANFEFVGLPNGYSAYHPTVSFSGIELMAPITPPGVQPPKGLPGFSIEMVSSPERPN